MKRRLDLKTNPTQLTSVREDDTRTPIGGSVSTNIRAGTRRPYRYGSIYEYGSDAWRFMEATHRLRPRDFGDIVDEESDIVINRQVVDHRSQLSIPNVSSVGRSITTSTRRLRSFDWNECNERDFNTNTGKQKVDQIRSRESLIPIGGSVGTTIKSETHRKRLHDSHINTQKQTVGQSRSLSNESSTPIGGSVGRNIKTSTRRLSPHDLSSIVDKEIDTNKEDLMDNQSSESSIQNVSPVGRSIKTGIRRLRPFDFNEFDDMDFNTNTCEQTVYQSPCRESLIPIGGSVGTTIKGETHRKRPHDSHINTQKQKVDQSRSLSNEFSTPIGGSVGRNIKTATRRLKSYESNRINDLNMRREDQMVGQRRSRCRRRIRTGIRCPSRSRSPIRNRGDNNISEARMPTGGSICTNTEEGTRRPYDFNSIIDKEVNTLIDEQMVDRTRSLSPIRNAIRSRSRSPVQCRNQSDSSIPIGGSVDTTIKAETLTDDSIINIIMGVKWLSLNDIEVENMAVDVIPTAENRQNSWIPTGGPVSTTIAQPSHFDSVDGAAGLIPYNRRNEKVSNINKRRNDRSSYNETIAKKQRLSDDWPPILRPFNLREWIAHNFPNRIMDVNEVVDIYNRLAPFTNVSPEEVTLTCYIMNEELFINHFQL